MTDEKEPDSGIANAEELHAILSAPSITDGMTEEEKKAEYAALLALTEDVDIDKLLFPDLEGDGVDYVKLIDNLPYAAEQAAIILEKDLMADDLAANQEFLDALEGYRTGNYDKHTVAYAIANILVGNKNEKAG